AALQAEGGDGADGAEDVHECGEVVRPHVEQRAGALGEQERRVRVDEVGPLPLHRGAREQRCADDPVLDGALGGLDSGAEDGVGGDAHAQPRLLRLPQQGGGGVPVEADGLLGPDVLAGGDGAGGDLGVHGGDGEVDDDLHVGVGEHVVGGPVRGDVVLVGLGFRAVGVDVAEDDDAHVGEGGEV